MLSFALTLRISASVAFSCSLFSVKGNMTHHISLFLRKANSFTGKHLFLTGLPAFKCKIFSLCCDKVSSFLFFFYFLHHPTVIVLQALTVCSLWEAVEGGRVKKPTRLPGWMKNDSWHVSYIPQYRHTQTEIYFPGQDEGSQKAWQSYPRLFILLLSMYTQSNWHLAQLDIAIICIPIPFKKKRFLSHCHEV